MLNVIVVNLVFHAFPVTLAHEIVSRKLNYSGYRVVFSYLQYLLNTIMKTLCLLISTIFVATASAQRHPRYVPQETGVFIRFDFTVIYDTITISKDFPVKDLGGRTYTFPFTRIAGDQPLIFGLSQRPDGADPDFNCDYPKQPILENGARGSISICMPGRIYTPPQTWTRRYIVNSSAENVDTITVHRVYVWEK